MHFEVLVEDASGKKMLDILLPKILGVQHSFRVINYRGVGHIPKNLHKQQNPQKRHLLNKLPGLLMGYGKTFASTNHENAVIVVCDLDDRCLHDFRKELLALLEQTIPHPETRFCIAIEEGEAWLLGDFAAIKTAYPKSKDSVLSTYVNDSICGTWEKLADAIYAGGSKVLMKKHYHDKGKEKSIWAERICPHMDITQNKSSSFNYFRETLLKLTNLRQS